MVETPVVFDSLMVSALDKAKRVLVSTIKLVAAAYGMVCDITRDSSDGEVASGFRKVSRRAHPDKNGGDAAAEERLKEINLAYTLVRKSLLDGDKSAAH